MKSLPILTVGSSLGLSLTLQLLVVLNDVLLQLLHVLHLLELLELVNTLDIAYIGLLARIRSSSLEVLLRIQSVLICHWILAKGSEVGWFLTILIYGSASYEILALLRSCLIRFMTLF